jgi:hypothetical protein
MIAAAIRACTESKPGTAQLDGAHPYLQVLGPIRVRNPSMLAPERSQYSCTEMLAWIHTHPGLGPGPMRQAMQCAEATRRSNLSKLRIWMGKTDDGKPYILESLSGQFWLDSHVTSDWEQFCVLISGGVETAPTSALEAALGLIAGEIFADRIIHTYDWANEWVQDMQETVLATVREFVTRCLAQQDYQGARKACAVGLTAVPGCPELLALRMVVEHQSGNHEQATLHMVHATRWAQEQGVGLAPCLVMAIQQINEQSVFLEDGLQGRVERARLSRLREVGGEGVRGS